MDVATLREGEGWRAWLTADIQLPEFPVEVGKTALLVIDMTYQQASRDYGLCKKIVDAGAGDDLEYYLNRVSDIVVPNIAKLTEAFRHVNQPIIYTICASLRGDGSDQTWRHQTNLINTVDDKASEIFEEIAPQKGDIVLVKTGQSIFISTNCDHLLHNMGITTLVTTGVVTNGCIEAALRNGSDLNYRMLMAEDCCATIMPSAHQYVVEHLDKYCCHVKSTNEILALFNQDASLKVGSAATS